MFPKIKIISAPIFSSKDQSSRSPNVKNFQKMTHILRKCLPLWLMAPPLSPPGVAVKKWNFTWNWKVLYAGRTAAYNVGTGAPCLLVFNGACF